MKQFFISGLLLICMLHLVQAQPMVLNKENFLFWHRDSVFRVEHFQSNEVRKGWDAYTTTMQYFEDIERSDTHRIRAYYSVMDMKRSWLSSYAINLGGIELENLLKHEKIHFDIQELHTRIYRKLIADKCQGLHKHNPCIGDIMGYVDFQQAKMNEEFDIAVGQRFNHANIEWSIKIQAMLDSLDAYKDPRVYLKIAP